MRPPPAAALLLLAAAAGLPSGAGGQAPDALRGRVVLAPDSSAVAGQTVVLHRVTPDTGMAVDSAITAPDGRFSMPLRGDPRDVFVVSARHAGILYFGPAVHGESAPQAYRVTVYDVRAAGPSDTLGLASRALVLTPGPGGVAVTDVVRAAGAGDRTLVGAVPVGEEGVREPWWRLRLPEAARNVRVLPGGVGAGQVEIVSGEARLSAPIPPTGAQVVLGYDVPRGEEIRLRSLHPVDLLEVVVREDVSGISVEGLTGAEEITSSDHRYRRYSARRVEAGRTVRVAVSGPGGPGGARPAWIAAGLGLLLSAGAVAAWWWTRRPRRG